METRKLEGNIFVTGGAGYLGRSIIERSKRDKWDCGITVFSRDSHKHAKLLSDFPGVRCIQGDVAGDLDHLAAAMAGHDLVIHAGASKYVHLSESNVSETIKTNVIGTENVAKACIQARVRKALLTSTDKACHPVNCYGATKMLGERIFQEYNRLELTEFHIARWGNVLASTGSFITDWQRKLKQNPNRIETTSAEMSRFWLSVEQAVDVILLALTEPAGTITIPKLPTASMGAIESWYIPESTEIVHTGLRPGEKRHEELLTEQEYPFAYDRDKYFRLWPVTSNHGEVYELGPYQHGFTSNNAPQLTREQFEELLK